MDMSRDPRYRFRKYLFRPNFIFNIRKSHKIVLITTNYEEKGTCILAGMAIKDQLRFGLIISDLHFYKLNRKVHQYPVNALSDLP